MNEPLPTLPPSSLPSMKAAPHYSITERQNLFRRSGLPPQFE
jgi:hypothetical protein